MAHALVILALLSSPVPAVPRQAEGRGPACVPDSRVAAPVVRRDGRLYFRGRPDRTRSFVAGFKGGRCAALTPLSSVAIARLGNRYCEGDEVRALNPPATIPGPVCILDVPQPFAGDIDD